MSLNPDMIKNVLEAALMAAGQPLSIDRLLSLFLDEQQPTREEIRQALQTLQAECETRGVELKEVSSGFRYQAKQDYAEWVSRLWEEKPPRYSRALLETLALVAYRQPITRGEIEDVRGVTVSTNIIKTLLEREWIKVVGHRDVPGKPAMYATTRQFLDYFSLKNLSDLPTLAEIRDIDAINAELDLLEPGTVKEPTVEAESSETESGAEAAVVSEAEAQEQTATTEEVIADDSSDDSDAELHLQESSDEKGHISQDVSTANDDMAAAEEMQTVSVTEEMQDQIPVRAADPM